MMAPGTRSPPELVTTPVSATVVGVGAGAGAGVGVGVVGDGESSPEQLAPMTAIAAIRTRAANLSDAPRRALVAIAASRKGEPLEYSATTAGRQALIAGKKCYNAALRR